VTSVSFDVPINDDNICEGNENFNLDINLSSPPDGLTVGDPGSATVTVMDDEGKHLAKKIQFLICYKTIIRSLFVV